MQLTPPLLISEFSWETTLDLGWPSGMYWQSGLPGASQWADGSGGRFRRQAALGIVYSHGNGPV